MQNEEFRIIYGVLSDSILNSSFSIKILNSQFRFPRSLHNILCPAAFDAQSGAGLQGGMEDMVSVSDREEKQNLQKAENAIRPAALS